MNDEKTFFQKVAKMRKIWANEMLMPIKKRISSNKTKQEIKHKLLDLTVSLSYSGLLGIALLLSNPVNTSE